MGLLVEGCSIIGGIDDFVAMLHMAILTGWLDFRGGGFSPVLEYCLGGSRFGFLLWDVLYAGPVAVAVVLHARVSEGKGKGNFNISKFSPFSETRMLYRRLLLII
jgi:hypothetical protein